LLTDMTSAVLDPLAPTPYGLWSHHDVRVRRRVGEHRPHRTVDVVCTPRFCIRRAAGVLTVEHDLAPHEVCDELAVLIADQLVDGGLLTGQGEFERVFTGVVRSCVAGGMAAWLRFYRNSLHKLESGTTAFAPVHACAAELTVGSTLLDLGSCFGFFPLQMSARGYDVTATDLSAPAMRLLTRVSTRLGRPLQTLACNALAVPLADRCTDTVTVLHLIEHLDPAAGWAVLGEALRLARRRVVVAVPFESHPRECYGHIRSFSLHVLEEIATQIRTEHHGVHARIFEHHGGWLVIDRPVR